MSGKERLSGIELLKIVSLFLIVLYHVTQTLSQFEEAVPYNDYVVLLGCSSADVQIVILNILKQLGGVGNNIFFACSAWFMIPTPTTTSNTSERLKTLIFADRNHDKYMPICQKAFRLACTVWGVSVFFLPIFLTTYADGISRDIIIRSLLPTCFANNWYITCYIIFLFVYPLLNSLITSIGQKKHLRIVVFTSLIWIFADWVKNDFFFPSRVILWITIYFLISYLKLYCAGLMNNKRTGLIILLIGILGMIGQVVITNYVGLHISDSFSNRILLWDSNCNPFYIMIAIGGVIVFLQLNIHSKMINEISGLSLLVYLIHENILLRTYVRPMIWQYIYTHLGYDRLLLWDIVYAILLFGVSLLISFVYKCTIQKLVLMISKRLYIFISRVYTKLEDFLLSL